MGLPGCRAPSSHWRKKHAAARSEIIKASSPLSLPRAKIRPAGQREDTINLCYMQLADRKDEELIQALSCVTNARGGGLPNIQAALLRGHQSMARKREELLMCFLLSSLPRPSVSLSLQLISISLLRSVLVQELVMALALK